MTGEVVLDSNQCQQAWQLIKQVGGQQPGLNAPTLLEYDNLQHLTASLSELLQSPLTHARTVLIHAMTPPSVTTVLRFFPQAGGELYCEIVDPSNDQQRTQRQRALKHTLEQLLSARHIQHVVTCKHDDVTSAADNNQFAAYQSLRAFQIGLKHQDHTQLLAAYGDTLDELMAFTYHCYHDANPDAHVHIDPHGNLINETSDETPIPCTAINEAAIVIKHQHIIANAHSQYDEASRQFKLRFYSKPGDTNDNASLLATAKLAFQEKRKRFEGTPGYLPFHFWGLDTTRTNIFIQHLFAAGFTHVNGIANPNQQTPSEPASPSPDARALAEMQAEVLRLSTRLGEVTSNHRELTVTRDDEARELRQKLEAAEKRARSATDALRAAEQTHHTDGQQLAGLTAERDKYKGEVTILTAQVERLNASALDEIKKHETLVATLRRQINGLEEKEQRLTAEVEALRTRAETAESSLAAEHSTRQEERQALIDKHDDMRARLEHELHSLRDQLASANAAAHLAHDALQKEKSEFEVAHRELTSRTTKIQTTLEEQIELLKSQLSQAHDATHAAHQLLEQAKTERDQARETRRANQATIDTLNARIAELEATLTANQPPTTRDVGTGIEFGEIDSVPLSVLEAATAALDAEKALHAATKEKLAMLEAGKINIEALQQEIKRLRTALLAQDTALREQTARHETELSCAAETIKSELASLTSTHAIELGDCIQAHENEMRALEGQINLLKASSKRHRAEALAANALADDTATTNQALASKFSSLEKAHHRLQQERQRLLSEIEQYKSDNDSLHHELDALGTRYRTLERQLSTLRETAQQAAIDAREDSIPFATTRRPHTNHRALNALKRQHKAELEKARREADDTRAALLALQQKEKSKRDRSTNTAAPMTADASTMVANPTPAERVLTDTVVSLLVNASGPQTHHSAPAQDVDKLLAIGNLNMSVSIEPIGLMDAHTGLLMGLKAAFKKPSEKGSHRGKILKLIQSITTILDHNEGIFVVDRPAATPQPRLFQRKSIDEYKLKQDAIICAKRLRQLTHSVKIITQLNKLQLPHESYHPAIGDHIEEAIAYLAAFGLDETQQIQLASDLLATKLTGRLPAGATHLHIKDSATSTHDSAVVSVV